MASPSDADAETEDWEPIGTPRPQALLLTFFGAYVLGREVAVATGSVLEVLGRVGVSEHTARSTLGRMARRGLLRRERRGRQVYLGLTSGSREILRDGSVRIWRVGAVNTDWDGSWTLLGFSLPESWQRQRHDLRSRLLWAGFGPLQGGLWIAPSAVDLAQVLEGLEAAGLVRGFHANPINGTDVAEMVADAWDLPQLAERYETFIARWDGGVSDRTHTDPLA